MKKTLKVPVVVCRNGHIATGNGYVEAGSEESQQPTPDDWDVTLDCMPDEAYKSGYRIVIVTAEVDVDAVFADLNINGAVEVAT